MRLKLPKIRIAWLMAAILVASVAFASLRYASAPWAATGLMLTLGLMAWAVLAAVYRGGAARAFWLGFAMFGWVYMAVTADIRWGQGSGGADLPTSRLTAAVHAYIQPPIWGFGGGGKPKVGAWSSAFLNQLLRDPDEPNRKIRAALELPIAIPFPTETPLEDVIKYIQAATIGPELPSGLPIYVDPVGLNEAEKTAASVVTLNLQGVPLRTSLSLLLKQLDLNYRVDDGLLKITSITSRDFSFEPDALQRIGHCWWAWVVGWIGGCVGLYLRATNLPRTEDGRLIEV